MLRAEIGDSSFFAFMKKTLTDHAYGSAATGDLLRAAEAVSGKSLSWFFEQWLMKPGHPVLDVSSKWDQKSKTVLLRVEQKQDTTGGVPIFAFPVSIGITTAAGHRVKQIRVSRAIEEFSISSHDKPILVEFDEPHHLLAEITFPHTSNELIVQLERSNALSRVLATNKLAEFAGDQTVNKALRKSSVDDPFWSAGAL